MKTHINTIGLTLVLTSILGLVCTARADELPDFKLVYRELTQRKELPFSKGGTKYTKPVGDMHWEFPATSFATIGFEPNLKTFCMEPLVPVTPGTEYAFRIDQFGEPKDFKLPNTEDGIKKAKRLVKFVRELYGKYYEETLKDPEVASPAFQIALWETMQEADVPDGPAPFDIYKGDFKAEYTKETAPVYVQRAQTYLSNLTGDDAAFTDSKFFAGQELVRLTGLTSGTTAAAQSQLAVRNRGGTSSGFNSNQPISAGTGGGGAGGSGTPRNGGSGLGGGSGGIGGGGGGGFIGGGGGGTTTTSNNPPGNDSGNPSNPNPVTPGGTSNPPGGGDDDNPPGGGDDDDDDPVINPNTGGGDNNPVPAPPAAILGLLAMAIFGGRKLLRRGQPV